jgi:hypothetical protein
MDPAEGGQLDVLDCLPGPGVCRSADELGLVVAVDGLSQCVVEAVPDRSDGGDGTDLGEAIAVAQ